MFDTMHTTIGKKEAVSSTGMSKQKKTVTLLCLLPCIQQVLQLAMDRSMCVYDIYYHAYNKKNKNKNCHTTVLTTMHTTGVAAGDGPEHVRLVALH